MQEYSEPHHNAKERHPSQSNKQSFGQLLFKKNTIPGTKAGLKKLLQEASICNTRNSILIAQGDLNI